MIYVHINATVSPPAVLHFPKSSFSRRCLAAASTLSQACGRYIDNVDPSSLTLSLLKGSVELRDLTVKKDALDQLGLPVTVSRGTRGGGQASRC